MLIRIERGSNVPISRQIADQFRAGCLSDTLRAGDKVPSVRELSRDLGVNPNTILRVYEKLTSEGLLERRHGDGTYVKQRSVKRSLAVEKRKAMEELAARIRHSLMLGIEPDALRELIDQLVEENTPTMTESSTVTDKTS